MKIYTANSAQGISCQIARIERGFVELGHEITKLPQEADLIYQNNAPFDQIIQDKKNGNFKSEARFIFNILDLAPHCWDFPIKKIKEQIEYADAITVISEWVKDDCIARLNFYKKYYTIYNPQMSVGFNKKLKKHPFKYLAIGRVNDPNKRIRIALDALFYLGVKEDEVGIIGSEYPGWGTRLGCVTEEYLNELYNSADYLLMPSKNEGIGLTAIEAASCGVIPVICNDLTTRHEFFPDHVFPEYNDCYPNTLSLIYFFEKLENNFSLKIEMKDRLYNFYKNELEEKFSYLEIAKRIVNVYNKIK